MNKNNRVVRRNDYTIQSLEREDENKNKEVKKKKEIKYVLNT